MRTLGRFLKWSLLLAVLAALVVVPYCWSRLGDQIRSHIEQTLGDHYVGLRVRVRFARLIEGQGIEVRGITIEEPLPDGQRELLCEIDELFAYCKTSLSELASGTPRIERFVVRRPRVRAVRRRDGSWAAARLWPLPKFSAVPVDGAIESGSLEIIGAEGEPAKPLVLRDLNLAVARVRDAAGASHGGDPRTLIGSFLADHLQRVEFQGHADFDADRWDVAGDVNALRLSPELLESLPEPLAGQLAPVSSLRGQADFSFRASHDPRQQPPLQFDVAGQITRGRIDDPRLPYPLVDLQAAVHGTQAGFRIVDLTAHNGATTLKLNCRQQGYGAGAQLDLQADCQRLVLDRQIVEFFPPQWRGQWPNFVPAGEIDAKLHLVSQGARWKPELTVRCRGISFAYYKFPYRLEKMWGTMELKNERLRIDLVDSGGGDAVRVTGELLRPGPDFSGWVDIEASDLPFDDKLFEAIEESPRKVIRAMNPGGTFHASCRCWRDPGPNQPLHKRARISVNGCTLRYDKFPYPLEDIRGILEMQDGTWTFARLAGSNDAGRVVAEGRLACAADGGEFTMRLTGSGIALESELRDALRRDIQRGWDELRPRGIVDLTSDIHYDPHDRQLSVWVRVAPQPETSSIEPRSFPYRMERLQGALVYQNGCVTIENLRAEHGRTSLATRGDCLLDGEGGWRLRLRDLTVDRLRPERELLHALPERLRRSVTAMNLSGPLNLSGSLDFARSGQGGPVTSEWDLAVETNQGSAQFGVKLDNIQGGVRLTGGFDGARLRSRGELQIDSVLHKQWQFTEVSGPFWIDDERVLVGRWAERPEPGAAERHLAASIYGGRVSADGWVTLGASNRYAVQASFANGDLATIAREAMPDQRDLTGKVSGELNLRGIGKDVHNLRGRGTLQVRDADVYELPVMVSLLKLLSIRAPDRTAFTKSDVEYRLDGGHIYFDRIDFNGDAVSLLGAGEMNLDREIRLTFHAVVGKGEFKLPVLRELIGGASQQAMKIHVGGTLSKPETRFEPFPALNRALQQLQVDLQPPPMRIGQ